MDGGAKVKQWTVRRKEETRQVSTLVKLLMLADNSYLGQTVLIYKAGVREWALNLSQRRGREGRSCGRYSATPNIFHQGVLRKERVGVLTAT